MTVVDRVELNRPAPVVGCWPEAIGAVARIGLAGRFLEAVEPITEADASALRFSK